MHLLPMLLPSHSECLVSEIIDNNRYIGNKADKEDDRQVTNEEEEKWCEKNTIKDHYETSAKTATNVQEAFESMVRKALAREKKSKSTMPGPLMKGQANAAGVKLNGRNKKDLKAKNACEC